MSEGDYGLESILKRGDDGREPPDGGLSAPVVTPVIQDTDPNKRGDDEQ